MLEMLWNAPLVRDVRMIWMRRRFARCLQNEVAEEFLRLLLNLMALALLVDPAFRPRVAGFEGRYLFKSRDGQILVGAHIRDGRMKVSERPLKDPHALVVFHDGRALMRSLLSAQPDLLGSLLRQDVTFEGNLNYIYRFAFLARRLQLSVMG